MTPVERAARALWASNGLEGVDIPRWDELNKDTRDHLEGDVRAVLLSLEEPSEAMVRAGKHIIAVHGRHAVADAFTDMILAALEEKP